jgi:hypothetical protein
MGEGLFENSPKTVSFLAKKEKKILFFEPRKTFRVPYRSEFPFIPPRKLF